MQNLQVNSIVSLFSLHPSSSSSHAYLSYENEFTRKHVSNTSLEICDISYEYEKKTI